MISVAIGGFFGAITRYQLSKWLGQVMRGTFPWPTFFINCSGSFLLGAFMRTAPTESMQYFVAFGFLGAFTTFSTFSYEAMLLLFERQVKQAFLYLLGSIVLCVTATAVAYYVFS